MTRLERTLVDHITTMTQTVHQAHHIDQPGTWNRCAHRLCSETARLFRCLRIGASV